MSGGTATTSPQRQFRPRRPAFDPAQAERQGEITRLAIAALGPAAAIAFLNARNETLDGRPIDIAGSSSLGLSTIAGALADEARRLSQAA